MIFGAVFVFWNLLWGGAREYNSREGLMTEISLCGGAKSIAIEDVDGDGTTCLFMCGNSE